jgi:hypothetical protein
MSEFLPTRHRAAVEAQRASATVDPPTPAPTPATTKPARRDADAAGRGRGGMRTRRDADADLHNRSFQPVSRGRERKCIWEVQKRSRTRGVASHARFCRLWAARRPSPPDAPIPARLESRQGLTRWTCRRKRKTPANPAGSDAHLTPPRDAHSHAGRPESTGSPGAAR